MWKCHLDNTEYSTLRGLVNHLRIFPISSKDYYDRFLKKEKEDFCKTCSGKTSFDDIRTGYKKYCSVVCAMKSDSHRDAVKNRFKNNPKALLSYRAKIQTYRENLSQEEIDRSSEKRVNTVVSKYGAEYLSERVKQQWKDKTPEERTKISEKSMDTRSRSYKYKKIVLDGKEFFVQGWEPSVIEMLKRHCKLTESEIVVGVSNVPRIDCGVDRKHYPDIFIPKYQTLIEVKSAYVYEKHKDKILENEKYAKQSGYNYIVLVFSRDPMKIVYSDKTKNGVVQKHEFEEFKNKLDWIISSQASVKDEGSTTSQ